MTRNEYQSLAIAILASLALSLGIWMLIVLIAAWDCSLPLSWRC